MLPLLAGPKESVLSLNFTFFLYFTYLWGFSVANSICTFIHLFLLYVYLFLLPALTSALFLSFLILFFSRLIPNPFLFITPQVEKFLLLWACPWRVSLIGQMSWLRPWPLLLLLHKELLLRHQFLHPSLFLPKRVLRLRELVSLFPFLLRSLLPERCHSLDVSQTVNASPTTPIISTSDPFVVFS